VKVSSRSQPKAASGWVSWSVGALRSGHPSLGRRDNRSATKCAMDAEKSSPTEAPSAAHHDSTGPPLNVSGPLTGWSSDQAPVESAACPARGDAPTQNREQSSTAAIKPPQRLVTSPGNVAPSTDASPLPGLKSRPVDRQPPPLSLNPVVSPSQKVSRGRR
jgi:hypothetical protein